MYKLLKVVMLSAVMVSAVGAQTWQAGEKVSATLSGGTLTIKGTGPMANFGVEFDEGGCEEDDCNPPPPWNASKSISNVVIENGVTYIGNYAFNGCTGLKSITIPNSVTSIGQVVFGGCTGLTSVTIPEGVKSVGYGAFYGSSNLTSVTVLSPKSPEFGGEAFGKVNMAKACLYVPPANIAAYRSANGWKTFSCIKDAASR
jgi:hypothetical protein